MTPAMIKISAMELANCDKDEYVRELIKSINENERLRDGITKCRKIMLMDYNAQTYIDDLLKEID